MKQRWKLVFLTIIMIILTLFAIKQSVLFYRELKGLPIPTSQTRLVNPLSVHRWMTVSEVAQKYGMTEAEVFEYLQIDAQPGDEKLTLRAAKIKFQKTPEQMQRNLQRIIDNARRPVQSP